jgi:hypothetical protein
LPTLRKETMIEATLLKEAIADAKAARHTELAWCKCPTNCMCEHCKPLKFQLALGQIRERLEQEKTIVEILESGKYTLRNQAHTLSEESLNAIVKHLERK